MFRPADEVTAVFRVLDGVDENKSSEHVLYLPLSALRRGDGLEGNQDYSIMMIVILDQNG